MSWKQSPSQSIANHRHHRTKKPAVILVWPRARLEFLVRPPFKLYWVETPAPEENTFVVARTRRAAARFEEDGTGFDVGDCHAVLVSSLSEEFVRKACGTRETSISKTTAFYLSGMELQNLGVEFSVLKGMKLRDLRATISSPRGSSTILLH